MIVYQSTRERFLADNEKHAIESLIAAEYLRKTGRYAPDSQYRAWQQSLMHMADVLADESMPATMGVGIEVGIPQTAKRMDFVLSGARDDGSARVVIIELKQWSTSRISDRDGLIFANRGGYAETEGAHPCYQAWSYAALLEGFNEAVHSDGVRLEPCAYLHNYHRDGVIDAPRYSPYMERAPLFLRGHAERHRLREFIKAHVPRGDNAEALYRIEHGRIRPSKMLADSLAGMLRGNTEFVLVDDQKVNCYMMAFVSSRTFFVIGRRIRPNSHRRAPPRNRTNESSSIRDVRNSTRAYAACLKRLTVCTS